MAACMSAALNDTDVLSIMSWGSGISITFHCPDLRTIVSNESCPNCKELAELISDSVESALSLMV